MGLLDRLFGTGAARTPAPPAPARKPLPEIKPPAAEVKRPETAPPVAAPAVADAAEEIAAAAPAAVETAEVVEQPADPVAEDVIAEPVEEPVEPAAESVEAAELADEEQPAEPAITPHLQARLDTYFARLRREFPDGRIVRLNTGHKKLAERGAELRRLIGYEGRLDEFFALGGFTYQRSAGGRPPLPTAQTDSVEERLREAFPDDVPTTLAVRQADARLYLDLRAAARREGCTVGEFLNRFRAD